MDTFGRSKVALILGLVASIAGVGCIADSDSAPEERPLEDLGDGAEALVGSGLSFTQSNLAFDGCSANLLLDVGWPGGGLGFFAIDAVGATDLTLGLGTLGLGATLIDASLLGSLRASIATVAAANDIWLGPWAASWLPAAAGGSSGGSSGGTLGFGFSGGSSGSSGGIGLGFAGGSSGSSGGLGLSFVGGSSGSSGGLGLSFVGGSSGSSGGLGFAGGSSGGLGFGFGLGTANAASLLHSTAFLNNLIGLLPADTILGLNTLVGFGAGVDIALTQASLQLVLSPFITNNTLLFTNLMPLTIAAPLALNAGFMGTAMSTATLNVFGSTALGVFGADVFDVPFFGAACVGPVGTLL